MDAYDKQQAAASKPSSVVSGVDQQSKRANTLADKLTSLQTDRKLKLHNASAIRKSIDGLKHDIPQLLKALKCLVEKCNDAKRIHESLLSLLPVEEKEKHNVWFKAKMISNNDVICETKVFLKMGPENVHTGLPTVLNADADAGVSVNVNDDVKTVHENVEGGTSINPNDSISNVGSKRSHRSGSSGKSSIYSARMLAQADRAALVARQAVLKEKHAIEEQEQQLRRRKEQLDLDAELAATEAKLAVLQASDRRSHSVAHSDGMNSYLRKEKGKVVNLNPNAMEYKPGLPQQTQHVSTKGPLPSNNILSTEACRKQTEQWCNDVLKQHTMPQLQHGISQGAHRQHVRAEQPPPTSNASHNTTHSPDLLEIMQRQNDITAALVHEQRISSLPSREIPVFDGDPLQFRPFMKAFEQGVESKAEKGDCLYYLEQFTRGQPQELVRSCQHMVPERGYVMAKGLLTEHFGNPYKLATAYMKKALAWQAVKAEDVKALQAYSLFLRGCCNVMQEISYVQELDMPVNMRTILSNLPFKLREQWRTTAHDIMEKTHDRAHIFDLVGFIERRVKILSDPLFGDIQDPPFASSITRPPSTFKSQHRGNVRGNIVAATDVADDGKEQTQDMEEVRCLCCDRRHLVEECRQFREKKHKDKILLLRQKGVCFACLRPGHMSKDCEERLTCQTCGKAHPTVLHIKQQQTPEQSKDSADTQQSSSETCGHTGAGRDQCVLSILPVKVKSAKGSRTITTYAFLDPGSSATFCSEHLMKKLKLTGKKTSFLLRTMGQEKVVPAHALSGLEVSEVDSNNFYSLPEVFTQKEMPVTVENMITSKDLARWPYLSKVRIPNVKANVDLLIGTNAPRLLEPWEVINSRDHGPYAIRTVLGWVVNGPLSGSSGAPAPSATVNRISLQTLEQMLASQYNHDFSERASEEKEMSRDDMRFMETMDQSAKLQDGKYCLKLPFKRNEVSLPNNIAVVKQRMQGLRRRFLNSQGLHKEYAEFVNGLISNVYAEPVLLSKLQGEPGRVWYIPHHSVHHPRKGSLRVVFDCGVTYQGACLNKELLQGPNLTSSLLGVLLRFREEPVAFMGDIQAMFHQVKVAEEDRDLLRFLWWPNGDITQELRQYRMTVHLFGAVSSPSCASYALRKNAEDHQAEFPATVCQSVKENFYVDDYLKSSATEADAIQTIKDLTALCQKGGFTLEKFVSNSRGVLQAISSERRAKDLKELDLDRDKLPVERALGLLWCVETDSFRFKIKLKQQALTRRGMLSTISSVYDPLGFLAPVTLPAKIMLQELCKKGCGWDDSLPPDILCQWNSWLEDLDLLNTFKISRCVKPATYGKVVRAQLHHFADASEAGYGTVTYLRMLNEQSKVQVSFLLGKARVTPLKAVTIPRLELTAAVLAVRMDSMLKEELKWTFEDSAFWTDSTSVLKYIKNEDRRFHTFVANRISTVRESSEPWQWRHVGSKDNPADDSSRGLKVAGFLKTSRWWEGPAFLWRHEEDWPNNAFDVSLSADDKEVKREAVTNAINVCNAVTPTDQLIIYFSDWKRLKKAAAWFLLLKAVLLEKARWRKRLKGPVTIQSNAADGQSFTATPRGSVLTVDDLLEAENAVVRYCQQQQFKEEIAALSSTKAAVSRQSSLYKLDPVLVDGLVRVGGRLSRAAMPEESKHPVILSKEQHLAALILKHVHQSLGHAGRTHTLSSVRKKFWITKANAAVRKVISECSFCQRYNGRLLEQKMADLPEVRIQPDLPPFTNTGVDYFGPVEVRKGRGTCKRYGAIFTCLASRAVHLEVAVSLETEACINALRRFISRRGQVTHLISDNGTNFVGADRELREAIAALNHQRIAGVLSQVGIRWSFNPPAGSHHGGVWERMIRMVRRILSSVVRQQTLDDDSLHTVFCEAEAILNDRPLTNLSDDPTDLEPLTPNHLLLLKGKPAMPPGVFGPHDQYVRRKWRQVQYIADLFWKRWVREYLPLLQERQRWNEKKRSLKAGDIVVIMDASAPRGSWPLARVLEVFPDRQGLVRSVRLQKNLTSLKDL